MTASRPWYGKRERSPTECSLSRLSAANESAEAKRPGSYRTMSRLMASRGSRNEKRVLPSPPCRDETRGQIDGDVGAQVAHLRPDRKTGDNGKRQKEDPAGRNVFHPHLHIIGCWCPLD